jgi:hypothetical protein
MSRSPRTFLLPQRAQNPIARGAAALEKVTLVAVQDRINLLSPADGSNLSEVIRSGVKRSYREIYAEPP